MPEWFSELSLFPIVLTVGGYLFGQFLQKKTRSTLCNPILIAGLIVTVFLLITKVRPEVYLESTASMNWLLTPATVSLAVPLYRQLKLLKKNLPAIFAGILAGVLSGLAGILGFCILCGFDRQLTISMLPKSITVAIGSLLSEQSGGISALTVVVTAITGILGNMAGPFMCKLFRLNDPISQGVAYGTASHVIGTARATETDPLAGAVSSLSLVVAGVFTAVIFPIVCMLL